MTREKKYLFLTFFNALFIGNISYGSFSFLRPFGWVQEPRLERPFLTSIDLVAEYMKATKAFNKEKKQIPLMELFDIPSNPDTSHEGSFQGAALDCRFTQNFDKGFFITGFLIYQWYVLKSVSPLLLEKPKKTAGIGDIITTLGWTYSYQETVELDFIDITLQIGALIPAARKEKITDPFPLPLGNSGHPAFIINGITGWGAFEWLTIGCGATALFSVPKKESILIKKDAMSDLILTTRAKSHLGPFLALDLFIKADHFIRGLSLGIGYSFYYQAKTHYTSDQFSPTTIIIDNDPSSRQSFQQVIHLYSEYDFTKNGWLFGPRIGLTYNLVVGGKNCFKTSLLQGTFGLDIAMDC